MADDPYAAALPKSAQAADPYAAALPHDPYAAARPAVTKPPPKPKVETPKDVRPNPLRTIGDVLEAPFAVMHAYDADYTREQQAIGRGERGTGFDLGRAVRALAPGEDTKRALSMIHDPHALSEEYGAGAAPELARESAATQAANPNGSWFDKPADIAEARQKNPLVNAAATIGEEFFNPANIVAGGVAGKALGYAGVGVNAARKASPVLNDSLTALGGAAQSAIAPVARVGAAAAKVVAPVTNAVGRANAAVKAKTTEPVARILNSFFSKYGDIENAAGSKVADVARGIDKRPPIVRKAVEKLTNQVFGKDLTREQKIEVVRRSYRDERSNQIYASDPSIPEPTKGLSLDERADLYRGAYNRVTPLLQKYGLLKDETRRTGTYDPRRRFNGRPIFIGDDVADTAQPFVPTRAMRFGETGNGSAGSLGVRSFNAKRYDDRLLTDVPDAELHPDFDPAHQFFNDLVAKHTSLSNEIGKGRFERAFPVKRDGSFVTIDPQFGQPVAARTPVKYANDDKSEFFGYGTEGEQELDKALKERANAYAAQRTKNNPAVARDAAALQITPEEIASARGLKARIFGAKREIVEASKASQRFGSLADYVTKRYELQKDRIGTELLTAVNRQAKRVDSLNAAIDAAQAKVTQGAGMARARQFAAMVDERDREAQRLAGVVERVERAASPLGLSAKSGYEEVFPLVDALPKQLAAKMRPLLEGAGDTPTPETLTAARAMLRSATTPEARELDTALERLGTRTTTGKLDDFTDSVEAAKEQGAKGLGKAMKRIGAIARSAQAAPERAANAATSGALDSQAKSMARAANAGVDKTGQRVIADMHREAQAAEAEVSRSSSDLYGKRDKIAKPSENAMYLAQGRAISASVREKMLREKKGTLEELAAARVRYDAIYQGHFDTMMKKLADEYADASQAPAGYVKEESGSPTGKDKFLLKEVADFLNQNGTAQNAAGDASKLSKAMSAIISMSRAGIVWLPIAHAGPNLGMAYLATNGSPARMAQILTAQAKFDAKLVARAEKAGATSEGTAVMFHDQGAHEAFTPTRELARESSEKASEKFGPIGGAVASAATYAKAGANAAYSGMNDWLFNKVERGYRIDLFDRLTKGGMSDGAAARKVNETFGKVGDLSSHESRAFFGASLNRVFYFYPWVKTVIPFWIKHGLVDPRWVDAPVRGIEAANEQQGYDDPSKPFTATAGKRDDGSYRRYKVFVPQAVTEMVAQAARAPFDAFTNPQDAIGDLGAPFTYAQGHLNTIGSLGVDLASAAMAYAHHSRPAPFNPFSVDPTQTAPQAIAGAAGKVAARAFAPVEQIQRTISDPASAFTVPMGGFIYGVQPQATQRRQRAVEREYALAINAARKRGDVAGLARLQAERAEALRKLTAPQPSPSPGIGSIYSQR